ncbi:MAG: hypothetical protein GDA49_01085 [Rhodospirillales bacterium]|nr:hypothetical protein [Rhodospirillales bacterium]
MTPEWNVDGRIVVNRKTCDWQPCPAIEGENTDLMWHPIRAEPGPGGSAKRHHHAGREEFVVLDGDGDGR